MESLKEKTAKGLFWGGLSNGLQQLLNLGFGIFLARVLDADDYGMVGMLTIFSLIASTLQESGFTAALINKKEVTHKDYNAVFWFSALFSAFLYFLLFMAAPLIAQFYETPVLTDLARYSFLGFFLSSLGIAHSAYLSRNLKIKQKAISSVIALTLSGIVGVTLAYLGYSYWGIATQNLVYIGTMTVCLWCFSSWRPTFQISFAPLRSMVGFSYKLLITNIFNHINHNLLSVILGKFYSETEVGYYNQANKWCGMGQQMILGMINGVAQPIFASASDDAERQKRIFRKMLRFAAFTSFPAMLGLGLVSEELIVIAVTDKWLPSVPMIQLLCIGGAFVPIINLYQQLIISKGMSRVFMWNIMALGVILLASALCTYPYGIQTMLVVYVSINISWFFVWHFFVQRAIGLSLFHALKDILPYAFIAAGVMAVTYYITSFITNIYFCFAGKIVIAAALYIFVMWASKSATFKESLEYLTKRRKS
ncbi:lipopolysaccharide biosynthesis protein [Bacteroides sp. 224]|uniref:lipopolysaccharide biosynthesis protein n=1 Tax=Bacteroides sp. 224 TaxID=2302936 RepID=UPI0013D166B4|nr:lipopolysaccharide biosynthesis protein [Bacteroides sp. 224]NDV63722.1 lipopolysaccharide biosynthesis protein [Bacteroides sp. 224]